MQDTLHIINAFETERRGSERVALHAARRLAPLAPVRVWSTVPPAPGVRALAAAEGVAIETIRPFAGAFPRGGRLIVWGTHYPIGIWLAASHARAVAIVCELFHHAALYRAVLDVRAAGLPEPRLVYVSRLLADAAVLDGSVLWPPADIAAFLAVARGAGRRFTVGRVSRDVREKHHRDDPALYAALAAQGIAVRVLGGACLAGELAGAAAGVPGGAPTASAPIELLPEGALPVPEFLATIDLFLYRTGGPGAFVEPSGGVVLEAMAAALPVVCGAPGGFTDLIDDGVNGYVTVDQDETLQRVLQLAADPPLRARLGARARQTARAQCGADAGARLLQAAFGAQAAG
ncbi:MAG: glycosyltransferase [Burkholderiales bacterium]|nr:glycosyltransferase [Burkholderiales bacterium]